jgi:hypothetical protein
MTAQVAAELDHIPKWPGEYQNELRLLYNAVRRASLGKTVATKRSAGEVMQDCLARMERIHPGAQFNYDKGYFEEAAK